MPPCPSHLLGVALILATACADAHAGSAVTPDCVSLLQFQSQVKDQKGRGYCWAFAAASAMEAAYQRQYGLRLHLSEQYIGHIGNVMALNNGYMSLPRGAHENNCTLTSKGGAEIVAKLARCAVPEAFYAPYIPTEDLMRKTPGAFAAGFGSQANYDAYDFSTTQIPLAARSHCLYRVATGGWRRIQNCRSPRELEDTIASGCEVVIACTLNWRPLDRAGTIWDFNGKTGADFHALLVVGYDRPARTFLVKNSWGAGWGANGYGRLTYDLVAACTNCAYYITEVADPDAPPQKQSFWLGSWTMVCDGAQGEITLRRYTDFRVPSDTFYGPTKVGTYTRDGELYDVNGIFSQDGQHLRFCVADTTDRIQPGTMVGQRFDMFCLSEDIFHAAGFGLSQDTAIGALMTRIALPHTPGGSFKKPADWLGEYDLNVDGRHSLLKLTSVDPPAGTLGDGHGHDFEVQGTLGPHGHELNLTVPQEGHSQSLHLLHFTSEKGVFTGTAEVDGRTLGALGFMRRT